MSIEIIKSVETIADYAKSVDDLGAALNKYLASYDRTLAELKAIRENEEAVNADIMEISAQIQKYSEQFENWQSKLNEKSMRPLLQISERAAEMAKEVLTSTEASYSDLSTTIKDLEPQVESIHALASTLINVQNELQVIPQISDISKSIQSSLGVLGNVEDLTKIADKLDLQIEEIKQERNEIIAPLKNAAAFSNVVQTENLHLSKELAQIIVNSTEEVKADILTQLIGDAPDSVSSKLDSLVSSVAELKENIISAHSAPTKAGGLRSLFGMSEKVESSSKSIDNSLKTAEQLFDQTVCIIEKPNWTNNFVFVINSIQDGIAYGNTYKCGEFQSNKEYPANSKDFQIYTGTYKDAVKNAEYENRRRSHLLQPLEREPF